MFYSKNYGRSVEAPVRVNRERWRVHIKVPLLDCSLNVAFGVRSHQNLLRDKQNVSQIVYRRPPRKSTCHPLPFFFFSRASLIEWASNASYFYIVHVCMWCRLSPLPHIREVGKPWEKAKVTWSIFEPRHCQHNLSQILQETIYRILWSCKDARQNTRSSDTLSSLLKLQQRKQVF